MQETSHEVMTRFTSMPARQDWIDDAATRLQDAVRNAYAGAGEPGQRLADFLHGVWLAHPLHPVLTDLPIGFWTSAAVFDAFDAMGLRRFRPAADLSVAAGVVSAAGAAASGITDWQHASGRARRTGVVHAAMNGLATLCYAGSLLYRLTGRRKRAVTLAMAGMGLATYGGHLGGELVFEQKMGTDHAPRGAGPREFTTVLPLDALPEGKPTSADVQGVELLLLRRRGTVIALANRCAHMGGPLADGEVDDGCIVCPWHGSRFHLDDGRVANGPSVFDQPRFETRVVAGQVEVRRAS